MYAGVVRVVAVVRSLESVSAAAAAAGVVYVVVGVVVAIPACSIPSALNTRQKYIPGTTTVISRFIFHTKSSAVHITKNRCQFFFFDTSSHRDRGIVRVLPFVYALLQPLLFFCTPYPSFLFPDSCRYRSQPTFLFTPRQLSTAAAAVVVQT